uniref:Cytochrome c oxidase subunit 2 n=1 Tax=Drepanidotaenia lanceolata TaxID=1732538 RepID=A0A0N9QG98_9CEST|nr:cytochrome c oxidase subunit II [Drepanidotaenia lanceolata]ALH16566.1 cytochrome c oxidase subunit 2 [Drepanidotaenia lanceolata]
MNLNLLYYEIICYMLGVAIFIISFVYLMLFWNFNSKGSIMFKSENQTLELVWTVFPTFLVLGLCMFNINYISEDLDYATDETVKIVGHQWYWSYETSNGEYDSFVNSNGFLVDKPLRLVRGLSYHLVVTSADVIHSFHVPGLNLKMDAIPGRLNHLFFTPEKYGVYLGYCAELCGVNHGIMPIVIEVVDNN